MTVQIDWIDAQQLEPDSKEADSEGYEQAWALLRAAQGVLVPGVLHFAEQPTHVLWCFGRD